MSTWITVTSPQTECPKYNELGYAVRQRDGQEQTFLYANLHLDMVQFTSYDGGECYTGDGPFAVIAYWPITPPPFEETREPITLKSGDIITYEGQKYEMCRGDLNDLVAVKRVD